MQLLCSGLLSLLWLLVLPHATKPMNKNPPPEIKEYPGFGRECDEKSPEVKNCTFSPSGEGNGTLFFSCKPSGTSDSKGKSYCFCGTGSPPRDELMFPLEWDGDSEKCLVGRGAPCGTDRGLSVACRSKDDGVECVHGRCRILEQLHSADVSAFCNDDFDCKNGLQCRESVTPTMVKIKRCYHIE